MVIWLILITQLVGMGFLILAWQRIDTARRAHDEAMAELRELQNRVTGLDVRLIPRVRDVVAQSRRAEGVTMPLVKFAHIDGSTLRVFDTESVFDLGNIVRANIPSACYGEGTCGLCLVRVTDGGDAIEPPSENERLLLEAHSIHDPNVRLACHLRPTSDITVTTEVES